jgi:hypothetical protein
VPKSDCGCEGVTQGVGVVCNSCDNSDIIPVSASTEYCLVMYNPCCVAGTSDASADYCTGRTQCQDMNVAYTVGNGLSVDGGAAADQRCCAPADTARGASGSSAPGFSTPAPSPSSGGSGNAYGAGAVLAAVVAVAAAAAALAGL